MAVLNAKAAVDRDRTRCWGWVSVGVSDIVLPAVVVIAVCLILLYAGIILLAATTPAVPTPRR